ncbi:MAG: phosphoglycerate kinase [Candidatus Falkowbacteria bacterium]
MTLNSIKKIKGLKNKKVLVRVDFNVPLENGKIKDDYRIVSAVPTINYLTEAGAKVILMAHLGDPGAKVVPELSLKPVAKRLAQILKKPVHFVSETVGYRADEEVKKMLAGEILFLENLRFNDGELKDDFKFAKRLAGHADVYVNEAFSVCHRKQASVSAIRKILPTYYGLQLVSEVKNLDRVLKPVKPLIVIMGGAKISTKAPIISRMYDKADEILLGGGLANNFFKHQKLEIGKSLADSDSEVFIKPFFKGQKLAAKIILPIDVVVCGRNKLPKIKKLAEVLKTDSIFDIGPETIALFSNYIKTAQTIIWNGPLGKFEENSYKHGTLAIATSVAARSTGKAFGLVGGGETVEALKQTKMEAYVDFVSTAGGAMLAYLGGDKMPGLK